MPLSPALATLFDDARAQAKRAGHNAVTPLHLAAALARRSPQAFEEAFGPGATAVVRNRLLREVPAGTDADTVALLQAAGSEDPVAVMAVLKQRLGAIGPTDRAPRDDATTTTAPPTQPPTPTPAAATGLTQSSGASAPATHDERLLEQVQPDAAIRGFDELIDELISLLSMRAPATPLVHGPGACGKSSAAAALATRLADAGYAGALAGLAVMRVVTATALSEDPIAALDHALDAQQATESWSSTISNRCSRSALRRRSCRCSRVCAGRCLTPDADWY